MTEGKQLGKIKKAEFGWGGYQDIEFGLTLDIGGQPSWGVGAFVKDTDRIKEILTKAKVLSISKLVGIPVECTFDGTMLREWRVLEEVL